MMETTEEKEIDGDLRLGAADRTASIMDPIYAMLQPGNPPFRKQRARS